ncbi:hypothetical protein T265_04530 [Opisthorchis viverrini]|uniref:Uncharacterized protein n=1 Tax=Opisthorchis viverrini TaxID=6198 RepID=A0A074ZMY5_OPIVI|nr:hypothetical protein T265_04530 [Opisthorchis viverrini]KER28743.1 hypothetical protein T265_04530 [Opisthorchis viverrini]
MEGSPISIMGFERRAAISSWEGSQAWYRAPESTTGQKTSQRPPPLTKVPEFSSTDSLAEDLVHPTLDTVRIAFDRTQLVHQDDLHYESCEIVMHKPHMVDDEYLHYLMKQTYKFTECTRKLSSSGHQFPSTEWTRRLHTETLNVYQGFSQWSLQTIMLSNKPSPESSFFHFWGDFVLRNYGDTTLQRAQTSSSTIDGPEVPKDDLTEIVQLPTRGTEFQ